MPSTDLKSQLSSWVMNEVDRAKLSDLFQGTLSFRHPGHENASWDARYEFEHRGGRYAWVLYSARSWDSIVPMDNDGTTESAVQSTPCGRRYSVSPR
jgi:hypothetical protein